MIQKVEWDSKECIECFINTTLCVHEVIKHLEAVNKLEASLLHKRELFYRRSFNAYASNDLLEAANILQAMLVEYPTGKDWN